jgi:hypothetical protein
MNMIYLTVNVSELEEILALLDANNIRQYQVIEQVSARTTGATPRMNTAVWPGYNSIIMVQASDAETELLLSQIQSFNDQSHTAEERVILCSWKVDAFLS